MLTHAGGVVVRERGGVREYLVVRPSNGRDEWVLPKGHIEPGEDAEEAALREVREEAGVSGSIGPLLGETGFEKRRKRVLCAYYLVAYERDVPADEEREAAWCDSAEVRRRITFANERRMLECAEVAVRAVGQRGEEAG